MTVVPTNDGIIIRNVPHFNPIHIFECGQAFRWNRDGDGYIGVVKNRVVRLSYYQGDVAIENTCMEDYGKVWKHYFDMNRDYGLIKDKLSQDPVLKKAVNYGWGIRILNQDPWETLISFIISSNNNILRIKGIIQNLACRFGDALVWRGNKFYSFPNPDVLAQASIEQLMACGCGYRASYVKRTAQMIYNGSINLSMLKHSPYDQAYTALLNCPGVGPKVADCILLFSMGKGEAFPVDVWIKRVMKHFYPHSSGTNKQIKKFALKKFGLLSGFAQQYLFYYARGCAQLF